MRGNFYEPIAVRPGVHPLGTAKTALLKISERKGGAVVLSFFIPPFFSILRYSEVQVCLLEKTLKESHSPLSTALACPAGNIISGGQTTHIESEMMMREDPISKSKSNKTLPRARLKLKVVSSGANGMQGRCVSSPPSLVAEENRALREKC